MVPPAADDVQQKQQEMETARVEMQRVLAERSDQELREMLSRLKKSCEQLNVYHEELGVEQEELKDEGRRLHETISLLMKETRKLHIGMENTVEPLLDEGPLDFVGRFWERVKPRDNQILVSENIGELKKPPMMQDGPLQIRDPVTQQFESIHRTATEYIGEIRETTGPHLEVASRQVQVIRESAGDLQQDAIRRVEGLRREASIMSNTAVRQLDDLRETASERLETLRDAGSEVVAPASARLTEAIGSERVQLIRQQSADLRCAASQHLGGAAQVVNDTTSQIRDQSAEVLAPARERLNEAVTAFESATTPLWKQAMGHWYSFAGMPVAPSEDEDASGLVGEVTSAVPSPIPEAEALGAGIGLEQELPEPEVSTEKQVVVETPKQDMPDVVEVSAPDATPPENVSAAAEEEEEKELIHESILIEARIKLDDGSVQVARVSARERCKDVAARFIREHSLKQWFEDPLCRFLKQAEDDAETFPVTVEGELLEIRKQFKK